MRTISTVVTYLPPGHHRPGDRRAKRWRGPAGQRGDGQRGKQKLVVRIVQQSLEDEVAIDRQGRRDERMDIDLRRAAEDDAVLIDEIDLAR